MSVLFSDGRWGRSFQNFLCGITPAPPHPNIEKVSLGAEKYIPWEKRKETWRVIDELKKKGVEIVSLEQAKNSISLNNFKPSKKPLALILGEEVKGLPKSILDRSDKVVHIPMYGKRIAQCLGGFRHRRLQNQGFDLRLGLLFYCLFATL